MLTLIIDVLVTSGLFYALATALPGVRLKSFGTALTVVLVYQDQVSRRKLAGVRRLTRAAGRCHALVVR